MKESSDLRLLNDARDYARRANDFAGGMSLEMLRSVGHFDHATRSYLTILGEALNQVSPELKLAHPEVPWSAIRGLRNRIVHAYWRVDHEIIQRIARDRLPVLITDLDNIISSLEAGDRE